MDDEFALCWNNFQVCFVSFCSRQKQQNNIEFNTNYKIDKSFIVLLLFINIQENIASGFQNLFDRGDLVDVTLACDGKLLQAHKIVLAICSPYFQEMFITNPCRHPISK